MEQEGDMPMYEVTLSNRLQAQQALTIRQIVADAADIEGLFAEVGDGACRSSRSNLLAPG